MAELTTTIRIRTVMGNKRVNYGESLNAGTGGDINTGLHTCEALFMVVNHTAVMAGMAAVNETLPCDGSAVTVVTSNEAAGNLSWIAIGD